nr:MAG TPA: hypothetical protein [Caudoviricetes sp.]
MKINKIKEDTYSLKNTKSMYNIDSTKLPKNTKIHYVGKFGVGPMYGNSTTSKN